MSHSGECSESQLSWHRCLRIGLLAITFFVPVVIMRGKSATYDEVAHLPAGYSYLTTGVIRLNPQHPPLIKEICALPLLLLGARRMVDKATLEKTELEPDFEWSYGRRFLYSQNADQLLFWGRVPAVLLSVGLAALLMIWARRLWGVEAGLLALFLYAFDPTITAHAQLVTSDVGLAFFASLFVYSLRRYLETPTCKKLVLVGCCFGCALGTKFSAVVLAPAALLLTGLWVWTERARRASLSRSAGYGATLCGEEQLTQAAPLKERTLSYFVLRVMSVIGLVTGIAFFVVWAIYLFPTDPLFYLNGIKSVNVDHDPTYPYYLMGQLKPGGWRCYFVIAWLIKTPIPLFLLLVSAVAVFFKKVSRSSWIDEAFLVIPAISFFVAYSMTADNLGIRYLIPCFPFLFIFTARTARMLVAGKRPLRVAGTIILMWYLFEFVSITPDHLSYFNQFAGGPRRGFEWLDDSNVDWGQGLLQLREYFQDQTSGDWWLCYFGSGDPKYYGIEASDFNDFAAVLSPPRGTLVLSAHCLARAQALMTRIYGHGPKNWIARSVPKAIVGHAYYIYEFH